MDDDAKTATAPAAPRSPAPGIPAGAPRPSVPNALPDAPRAPARRATGGRDDRPAAGPLGRAGEDVAAAYVRHLGWRILARNWRPSGPHLRGEVDLIALDGATLVVCEVKTRRGRGAGAPAEAVTAQKLRRLRRLAAAWLHAHPGHQGEVRVDVLGLHWPYGALAPAIGHDRDVRA